MYDICTEAGDGTLGTPMAVFKDIITIKDPPWDRAVQITVIAPADRNVLNLQQFAERAWRAVGKQITVDGITVKVRAFSR
jgi:hypothetical protein